MKIVIAWNELPFYAAAQLRHIVNQYDVTIIGTKPSVPIKGMDELLNHKIIWIDSKINHTWSDLNLELPDVFFHTGWAYPVFNNLATQVLKKSGKVVSIVDNIRNYSIRQFIGTFYYKFFLDHRFSALWVPGKAGKDLCKYLGASDDKIFTGVYAGDSTIFNKSVDITDRDYNFLFVGQFISRKSIIELVYAFNRFHQKHKEWKLTLIGCGPLYNEIPKTSNIIIKDFLQPEALVVEYNKAKAFILPSKVEHFGLVVHEAALCGCPLILGENVGAKYDLLRDNGIIINGYSVDSIYNALCEFANWDHTRIENASQTSQRLASNFGGESFVRTFRDIIYYCINSH